MKTTQFYSYIFFGIITALFAGYQIHIYNLKKSAQQDIDFIHQTFLENHPGVYNDRDPDFVKNMNTAYQDARNSILSIKSAQDHEKTINSYLASFHDPHVIFFSKNVSYSNSSNPENIEFAISSMPNDIVWISLPTFQPSKEDQEKLKAIINQISQYQTSKLIVFDLRGNGGGCSEWGTQIIASLFGKDYAAQSFYALNKNIEVDWRASKDNLAHLSYILDCIKDEFGEGSLFFSEVKKIEAGVKQAYKEHKIFYTEYTPQLIPHKNKLQNPITAKIVAITSSRCASSCLTFIDELKAADPKTILIGQTTSADTIYNEMRYIYLPSGLGKIQFPIKLYRNTPRGNNVPYIPNIPYPADINSEEAKNQWLLETIQELSTMNSN